MSQAATTQEQCIPIGRWLYVALELSSLTWKVASGLAVRGSRLVSLDAGDLEALLEELMEARVKAGLPADAPVTCCYEAGRDGFWIHRALEGMGITTLVVDPGSIERSARKRAKTDRLDARRLLGKLIQHAGGADGVWSVVRVPSEEAEEGRISHRELEQLKKDRNRVLSRVREDLIKLGPKACSARTALRQIPRLRRWDGRGLAPDLVAKLERCAEQVKTLEAQIDAIETVQRERLAAPRTQGEKRAQALRRLWSIGDRGSWDLSMEFLGWREFSNRREVGAAAGLVGTPHASGEQNREQGISKTGNRRVRRMIVELSWLWLRYQPESAITKWWQQRFAEGSKRMRRVGITAVARKLLIALWRYLEFGEIPEGARLKPV